MTSRCASRLPSAVSYTHLDVYKRQGYFLGGIPFLQKNIEAALVAIGLVSVLPMAFEWWRHRRAGRSN